MHACVAGFTVMGAHEAAAAEAAERAKNGEKAEADEKAKPENVQAAKIFFP